MAETREVNIFNPEKRRVLCIANKHDYLGDGTIFYEKELQVGKQYTFVKGEAKCYGLMVYLEELPNEHGYQNYLFAELEPYDEQILKREYNNWLRGILEESAERMKKEDFDPTKAGIPLEEFLERQAIKRKKRKELLDLIEKEN